MWYCMHGESGWNVVYLTRFNANMERKIQNISKDFEVHANDCNISDSVHVAYASASIVVSWHNIDQMMKLSGFMRFQA